MKVYAYKNCSSCQKALKYLDQHNLPYQLLPIVEQPPSLAELQQMLQHVESFRNLFNTSGTLYRELKIADRLKAGLSPKEALQLLSEHGKLIKRPFLLGDKVGAVGFKPQEWDSLFRENFQPQG